jgi:amino acid transporter
MGENESSTGMKKTLGLLGVTINAMALIAPGAFLWITYQVQAAQTDSLGNSTAPDMWFGLAVAILIALLTAISYSALARRYPDAGAGSSYNFTVRTFLDRGSSNRAARGAKFTLGWISHLYYWVYPGVMVAFMAILISYILTTLGFTVTPVMLIGFAVAFAAITGFISYRGIVASTRVNLILNIWQWIVLISITVLALIYRFLNPQYLTYLIPNLSDIVPSQIYSLMNPQFVAFVIPNLINIITPQNLSHVLFQATIAILLIVGFESATALMAEAKNPGRDVPRGIIIALIVQGICYLFEYFGAQAWINTSYTVTVSGQIYTGFAAAAQSSAPIGDMVTNLGNSLLGGYGLQLMLIVAISVAAAILGTTLACINTGVRISFAMGQDNEMPRALGELHKRNRIPHKGVLVLAVASAVIGAFGALTVTNLTAIALISNIGTFILYGLTNAVAFFALAKERGSIFIRRVIPNIGAAANIAMLVAVVYIAVLGGGATQYAAFLAIAATGVWALIGVTYFAVNSKTAPSAMLPYPGKKSVSKSISKSKSLEAE